MCTRPDAAGSDQKSVSICGCRKEFWPRIDSDETSFRKPNQGIRSTADRVSGTGISDSRLQHRLQTFFATRRKLSGRNGETVSVSGFPRTKTTNPKQEKEITL